MHQLYHAAAAEELERMFHQLHSRRPWVDRVLNGPKPHGFAAFGVLYRPHKECPQEDVRTI